MLHIPPPYGALGIIRLDVAWFSKNAAAWLSKNATASKDTETLLLLLYEEKVKHFPDGAGF